MCQSIEEFQFWFLKVKYEATGLIAKILSEIIKKKKPQHVQRFCAVFESKIRSSLAFFLNCCILSSTSSFMSFFTVEKRTKTKSALTLSISNINVFLQRDNMHDSVHISKNRLNKSHWLRNLLRTRLYKKQNSSHWPWHTGIGGFPCCEGRW